MQQANVEGVVNADRVRRGDSRGHVTGIWNGRYVQILWDRPGPIIRNTDGFSLEEVERRFRLEVDGGWEIEDHESDKR